MLSSQQNYIKENGCYMPINAVASGIRCKLCRNQYPREYFDIHLRSHVPYKYLNLINEQKDKNIKLGFKKSARSKILFNEVVKINSLNQFPNDQINIRSFLPEEMPSKQLKLKKINALGNPQTDNFSINAMYDILSPVIDSHQNISSQINSQSEQLTKEDHLYLQKQIKIPSTQKNVIKKKINFYKNQKTVSHQTDNIKKQKKTMRSKTQIDQMALDKYQIFRRKDDIDTSLRPVGLGRSHFNFNTQKKKPSRDIKIHTFSQYLTVPRPEQQKQNTKLMCKCCKGFYCKKCKSDIPPIYRPVPDQNGNYYFEGQQINKKNADFYRQHFMFKQQCPNCDHHIALSSAGIQVKNTKTRSRRLKTHAGEQHSDSFSDVQEFIL